MIPIVEVIESTPENDALEWLRAVRNLVKEQPARWLQGNLWENEGREAPDLLEPGQVTYACAAGFGCLLDNRHRKTYESHEAYRVYVQTLARTVDPEHLLPEQGFRESERTVESHNDEEVQTPEQFVAWLERGMEFLEAAGGR